MRRLTTWALLTVFLGLLACRWSVPADPGRNAALRTRRPQVPVSAAAASPPGAAGSGVARALEDTGAREIYYRKCAQCHEPFDPSYGTASEWVVYVDRYGPRAGLFGAERERVLRWLQAHSR